VLADLVAEARAQRQALLVILDEIRGNRGGPPRPAPDQLSRLRRS